MLKLTVVFFVVFVLSACIKSNQNSFYGFWEGPHPNDDSKKFYVNIFKQNDSIQARGYWTENKFYQSSFEINKLFVNEKEISFYVSNWNCTYRGTLVKSKTIYGGFDCIGEAFDSVRLVKNHWIENYLTKPKSNLVNNEYVYKIPEYYDDGIFVSKPELTTDSVFIYRLVTDIINGNFGRINSFLLYKNKRMICEEYFYGYSRNDLHQIESCTKSITSLLIAIAVDMGFITNLNQKIHEIFEEYAHLKNEKYRDITIEHLLSMTSGFEVQEEILRQSSNRTEFALSRNMVFKPGTTFQYDGGNTEILGAVIKRKTGMSPDDFARKYLFTALKITNYTWDASQNEKVPIMSGSLCLTPVDMLKIGVMVLNDGKFNQQQIVSKERINEFTTVKCNTHIPGSKYSYQWWNLNIQSKEKNYNVIWANGWGSQFIYIIPELNVVIVTTGHNYEYDSWAITKGISKYLYLLDKPSVQ